MRLSGSKSVRSRLVLLRTATVTAQALDTLRVAVEQTHKAVALAARHTSIAFGQTTNRANAEEAAAQPNSFETGEVSAAHATTNSSGLALDATVDPWGCHAAATAASHRHNAGITCFEGFPETIETCFCMSCAGERGQRRERQGGCDSDFRESFHDRSRSFGTGHWADPRFYWDQLSLSRLNAPWSPCSSRVHRRWTHRPGQVAAGKAWSLLVSECPVGWPETYRVPYQSVDELSEVFNGLLGRKCAFALGQPPTSPAVAHGRQVCHCRCRHMRQQLPET